MKPKPSILSISVLAAAGGLFLASRPAVAAEEYGAPLIRRFAPGPLAEAARREDTTLGCEVSPASPLGKPAVKLRTEKGGLWLRLKADPAWRPGRWLAFDAYYDGEHAGMIRLGFYAKGEKSPRLRAVIGVFPRLATRIAFPLDYLDAQTVFMKRTPPRLKGVVSGNRIAPDELAEARIGLVASGDAQTLYLSAPVLLAAEPDYPVPAKRVVDELGQWKERDWPGKTHGAAELRRRLNRDLAEARAARFPEGWSRFGGWKEKRFQATGFFRVAHDGRRWWLVDPEGCGFFSVGLDCVTTVQDCPVLPGMEKLFDWLPEPNGRFAPAVSRRRRARTVFFTRANLIRAFGDQWAQAWAEMTLGRMRAWGFNTIANWSELGLLRGAKMPYVVQLGNYPRTSIMLFRDFPDVFSKEFREAARRYAQGLRAYKDDPYLIGYFMRNEPVWGFGRYNLAAEMLEARPGTATRRALAEWLRKRYRNDPQAWAAAWKTPLHSFSQIVTDTFHRVARRSPRAEKDLWEFSREMVRAYVRIPVEEARKVDPNHLNLGMRYAWISSDLLLDAGESFDVFSINCYRMQPDFKVIERIAKTTGKPVMIGEFHFGALDRGMPATGLRGVASQAERGVAYRRYVESVIGRFDGENYQIGFVDVCHTPYRELVEAAKTAHRRLYPVMEGRLKPFDVPAKTVPAIRY